MEKLDSLNKLDKAAGQSMDIVADNIAKLKELFPEILTENKINFDTLKALLGEEIEVDDERYSFNWHGKAQARRLAQSPSTGTLRPCQEESVDWDSTKNLFIEGDNLEVLKLLQKSYHKRVKMIYIDPPYNTGTDFVYPDNFSDNIQNYLEITGQVESGRKIGTNAETSGRYHTDWLNMMYPRLKLAKNLLSDDGVIFISIDDNEVRNLRIICDEIFGEQNFVGSFLWKKKGTTTNVEGAKISSLTEYVITYGKNSHDGLNYRTVAKETREYLFLDGEGKYRKTVIEKKNVGAYERKTMQFEIIGKHQRDGKRWQLGEATARVLEQKNRFILEDGTVKLKIYDFEDKDTTSANPNTLFEHGSTDSAASDLAELLDEPELFSNPKPKELLGKLLELSTNSDSDNVVLDFFAGSGTTGQSVMWQQLKDSVKRKFILVQLPEPLDLNSKEQKIPAEFCKKRNLPLNLSEITKERIRSAANKIKIENPDCQVDLGFKVFKLDSSNLKPWDTGFDSLAQDLTDAIDIVKADRKPVDVLFEILLKYGLDLTLPSDTHTIAGKMVFEVGAGALIVCLDDGVTEAVAEGIGKLKEQLEPEMMRVVFKDSSFASDAAKVNAVQVLKQYGIDDVRASKVATMKIQFSSDLDYQQDAISAITGVFDGQNVCNSIFTVANPGKDDLFFASEFSDLGIGNRLQLLNEDLLENIQAVQLTNGLKESNAPLTNRDFTIEMETGTGKTYVYLRSIFELNQHYGFTKFIIVVPSIAIKEGVYKTLQITEEHFKSLYTNIRYDYFIYDGAKRKALRDFATNDYVQIMVINIDAFKKSFENADDQSKANLIHRSDDQSFGVKWIDYVKSTNPIVIIDEPQSVDTTSKSKEAIKSLNPLCTFRFSATHLEKHHQLYKLDAVDAYQRKLVKQIEVAELEIGDNHNNAYIKLIKVDNKKSTITAEIELDVVKGGAVDRIKKKIKSGDDLLEISGGREIYDGYVVNDIYCAIGEEYIDFTSKPEIIRLGENIGGVDQDSLKRLQIRKTIEEQLGIR